MTTSRIAVSGRAPARLVERPPDSGTKHRAYFPALDGIRAVAFLMVFGTHYLQLPWGWTGVNVFFVLSGFLITGILYDTRYEVHRVWNFYLRRTLRIFPLYYGLMLLLVLLYPIFHWQWSWAWLIWPAYLGNMTRCFPPGLSGSARAMLEFAQPVSGVFPSAQLFFGHFWSLCVEEQFYLIWPWVVFGIASRGRLLGVCITGVIAMPFLRLLATQIIPQAALDPAVLLSVTPLPFDALLLGAIVALLRRGPEAHRVLALARIGFWAITTVFVFWLALHPAARRIAAPYPYPTGTFIWGIGLIDALAACVMVMAIESGSLAFWLFNLRPLRWLGRISYGAYVFHDVLHGQIARVVHHYTNNLTLPTAAIAFAVTLLCAWASFRWFETPFIRLKDRWTRASIAAESGQEAVSELDANSPSDGVVHHLPAILRRFIWIQIALAALCIAIVVFCRDALHLGYPYDTPVLRAQYNYHDYWMFTDRFHHFHSTDFFTAHAEFIFSYPAPMAVLYKLTYMLTGESTRGFLGLMAFAFIAAALLFGRALMKAGVALEPVVALTATALLLSDPIWYELNRANLEFYVWIFVTLGVWLFFRGRGYGAAACFGAAGAMKLFPFVYLGLLIAKRQYRQVAFGFAVSAAVTIGSLWLLCPDVLFAWRTLNANANVFGRDYLYHRLWLEVGFDHSLFALIKMLWRHLPGPAVMSHVLSAYMGTMAVGGTLLFFLRIRYLPQVNQLVCLSVASVLLPPSSADYTLIHLYAPWAAMVFVAFDAARAGRNVAGLGAAFVCFAILLSTESEFFFRYERAEGMIKAATLMALWYIAMKYPFETATNVLGRDDAQAYIVEPLCLSQ